MPAEIRRNLFDPTTVGAYHCYTRCARRAFLCGDDDTTGADFKYRRGWVRDRLEALASVFAVDVLDHAVMENHVHVILRNRPDVARDWKPAEVIRRWSRLSSKRLELLDEACESEVLEQAKDDWWVGVLRARLSSISWFMAMLNEPLARKANKEDEVSGHFWAERFGSTRLEDDESLLVCSLYVDLNPVRAGQVDRPELAEFTGLVERLRDWRVAGVARGELPLGSLREYFGEMVTWPEFDVRVYVERPRGGWMSPLREDGDGYAGVSAGRRASDVGYLPISFPHYLEVLDECGRREVEGKRGVIPADLPPILERLGLRAGRWSEAARAAGRRFGRIARQCADQVAERQRR